MEVNVNSFTYKVSSVNRWAQEIAKKYGIDFSSIRTLQVEPDGKNNAFRTITIVYFQLTNDADILITQIINEYEVD